jgi:hypothetical protein
MHTPATNWSGTVVMANLQNWVNQAREHWKEFQPNRYSALVKSGKLEAALQDAAERTLREQMDLEDQGFDPQAAWEMVRERYLFVPEEGKKPTAYSESYFNRPTLTTVLHEAIATGTRTIEIPQPRNGSRPLTADQQPRIALEKTVARVDPEVRRAIQRERDDPKVNILSGAPLHPPRMRHYSERRVLVLLLIWIVISVPLVDFAGWIGAVAAVFGACLLAYIEHIQRERDREAREREV